MKKNKCGISLIVLVITIIVMVVLAGAVIITLDNSGVIGKSNEAVTNSNLKQVEQLASLAWAEAFLDDNIKTDEQYKEYVEDKLIANNIKLENYYIEITASGVKVEGPDTTKPTVTIIADKATIKTGETITYTVIFNDNKNIDSVNLTTDDITLNGFVATKEITGEGNVRTITLSNVQGESGEKSITIREGVAKDTSGNITEVTDSSRFELVITLGALITSAEDYGKEVNYVSDNGVTGWKVFYKQTVGNEEYVYLIASEKLAYDKVPISLKSIGANIASSTITLLDDTTRIVGNISWEYENSIPSKAATIQNPSLWMANWNNGNYNSNPNTMCISHFLDETHWVSFKNTTSEYSNYVVGAIGTTTMEMFVASWNEKRNATNDTKTYNYELKLTEKENIGYYINDKDYLRISTKDSLYIWGLVSGAGIWFASPNCAGNQQLWIASGNDGLLSNYRYYYCGSGWGIRPVVCLSADIPAKAVGTTGYEI